MNALQTHTFRPMLKTKKFSLLHIELFEQILLGRTNRDINKTYGYTMRSHTVVDHSRKVMFKLLCLENLSRREHEEKVIYPRRFCFWWNQLLEKHRAVISEKAITPEFY